jgi:multiple sugar transport system substrate-binding protein
VAGINLSIFKNTKNASGAMKFVKFMTSKSTQQTLDKPFTALPVIKGGTVNFTDNPAEAKAFSSVLATKAEPLPLVPAEAAYETNVGNVVSSLVAQAATGKPVTDADVRAALKEAEDKMAASGGN